MVIFIYLCILLLNIVAIFMTYKFLGEDFEKKEKSIFLVVGIAIMYMIVSLVYWLSTRGIDLGINNEINQIYVKKFKNGIASEKDESVKNKIIQLNTSIEEEKNKLVKDRLMNIHRSLSFLPRDEMIYMAEGMINLTSFKRRLVLDNFSETVGGPIDIAFISKGDGFIWIKRKKYFDKEMNYVFTENYFNKKGE